MFDWMIKRAKSVNLFITSLCNISCPYCCVNDWITDDEKSAQYMKLKDLYLIIELLKKSQIDQVRLLGGEPMLHPHVYEFSKRLLEEDINKISILTNGLGHTEDYKQLIDLGGIRWCVNVNNPSTYTPEEWDLLNKNLRILSWKGERDEILGHEIYEEQGLFQLQLSIVFYDLNQDYKYIIDLAKKYGSPIINFDISHPSSNKTNTYIDLEEMIKYKHTLLNFCYDCITEKIKPSLGCVLTPCVFTPREMMFIMLSVLGAKFSCAPGLDIMPDLNVEYCSSLRGLLKSYNLRKIERGMTFQDIFRELTSDVEKIRELSIPFCENCYRFDHDICQGYCLRLKSDFIKKEPEMGKRAFSFLNLFKKEKIKVKE